jgi:uncharacterized radical SAM superfamily protein
MGELTVTSNVAHPDDTYQLLVDLHAGLTDEESMRVNAKLVLLLINHIGDEAVVREAILAARGERRENLP